MERAPQVSIVIPCYDEEQTIPRLCAALDDVVRKMFLLLMEVFSQRSSLKVGYAYRSLGDVGQLAADQDATQGLMDVAAMDTTAGEARVKISGMGSSH